MNETSPLAGSSPSSSSPSFQPWLGVFETVAIRAGRPLLLAEHQSNIEESSAALGLPLPPKFSSFVVTLPLEDGRWRWLHDSNQSSHGFQVEALPLRTTFSLEVSPQRLGSRNWDARFKTYSYLTHWQARQSVETDEALLLNERGEIASGAMSNLFWVERGRLYTPALETGCRNGAVRRWVSQQFQPESVRVQLGVLREASEIFLTNSLLGIQPVTRFQARDLSVGSITSTVQANYQKNVARVD